MVEQSSAESVHMPPLVAGWLEDLFGGPIPGELRATCHDCAMCKSTQNGASTRFHPDVKCCSFLPSLPNFAVGGVLNDMSPETDIGRASVEARIDAKAGVTPLGLDWPAQYALLYTHSENAFGRSRALRCPHYIEDGGLCGIWRYRNSVCSTYYCQVVRGAVGREFWRRLQHLLTEVEMVLEYWCVEQLHIGSQALKRLLGSRSQGEPRVLGVEIDGGIDLSLYHDAWGEWAGRERRFYLESAQLVSALAWSDIQTIVGPTVRLAARLSKETYDQLVSHPTIGRLRRGQFTTTHKGGELSYVQGVGAPDQLVVLAGVVDILPLFDGHRPTADVQEEAKRLGTRITDWTVQQLVDFHILVPAP